MLLKSMASSLFLVRVHYECGDIPFISSDPTDPD